MIAYETRDITIRQGHILDELAALPERSVHCCVTSPPYWRLRDYGTEHQAWDGDPSCDHDWRGRRYYVEGGGNQRSAEAFHAPGEMNAARLKATRWKEDGTCAKCGAWRGELGQEPTPGLYVDHVVQVARAVRRVLRDDGTFWLNVGDTYNAYNGNRGATSGLARRRDEAGALAAFPSGAGLTARGIPNKSLCLIPQRLLIALQEDGWHVRSVIVWAKTACMPESVRDRPTSAHEYVYLLTKKARYYYDAEAVAEPTESDRPSGNGYKRDARLSYRDERGARGNDAPWQPRPTRNMRNVWWISGDPLQDEHYAAFPSDIPRRAILAGTSERGCCSACGASWHRVVQKRRTFESGSGRSGRPPVGKHGPTLQGGGATLDVRRGPVLHTVTTGWSPTCHCDADEPVPCTVLDPFGGSGRTADVARELGRRCVLVELKPEYVDMERRLLGGQVGLWTPVEGAAS